MKRKTPAAATVNTARRLRRGSTKAEHVLWLALRSSQIGGQKFRRQHQIGTYIVDFYCAAKRLIIEVDGGQHASSTKDKRRTNWLVHHGYRVVRFWNLEILTNCPGVLDLISKHVEHPAPHTLSPQRGEREGPAQGGRLRGIPPQTPGREGEGPQPVTEYRAS